LIDLDEVKNLFFDILTDWDRFGKQIEVVDFAKYLWYGFALEKDGVLKEGVNQCNRIINSDIWQLKFYRFITKMLKEHENVDLDKINRTISRYKKINQYSIVEREFITEKIISKIVSKLGKEKVSVEEVKVTKNVIKLTTSNIPLPLTLKDIDESYIIQLAVYSDNQMNIIIKTIPLSAKTNSKKTLIYIDELAIKKIKKESKHGYVNIIDSIQDYFEYKKLLNGLQLLYLKVNQLVKLTV
jgi:hypothetical protein